MVKKTHQQKKIKPSQSHVTFFNNKFFIIVIVLLLLVFFAVRFKRNNELNNLQNKIIPEAVKKIVNNQNAKIKIENLSLRSGVVQFDLKLDVGMGEQKYVSYITKDGKILFTSGIDLEKINVSSPAQSQKRTQTCEELEKNENPILTAYVMADCPYGLQMQRVFKMMIEKQPTVKNNLRVEYIFDSNSNFETGDINALHGKEEAQENLRQICIREEQQDLYWPYVSCYMKKKDSSSSCLTEVGVNKVELDNCMKDKNRGLTYAKKDFDNTNKLGASGSPTLVLNGKQLVDENGFGGRSPKAIKEILCCSANKKLPYCSFEFSSTNAIFSFSETDEQQGGNTQGANCN